MRFPFNGNFKLTQGFGENPPDYAKFDLKGHNGLDYGTPSGTNILAPHSGKVIEATNDPSGYGNYLKIENDKEGSVLAHLQNFLVTVGQTVTEGQLVGISDNTGNSTGPHLHWGYYTQPRNRQNGYGGFIDQLPLVTTPAPTPTPQPPIMNDQTLIPLGEFGTLEIQQIRGLLGDKKRVEGELKSAQEKLTKIKAIVN